MAGGEHISRASKPAPTRYGSEANPIWATSENTDTPEANTARPSGELPPEALQFPPAQSSAAGGSFRDGYRARRFVRNELLRIHELARRGEDLTQIGIRLNRSREDIDLALWALVGSRPVGQVLEELNAKRPA